MIHCKISRLSSRLFHWLLSLSCTHLVNGDVLS